MNIQCIEKTSLRFLTVIKMKHFRCHSIKVAQVGAGQVSVDSLSEVYILFIHLFILSLRLHSPPPRQFSAASSYYTFYLCVCIRRWSVFATLHLLSLVSYLFSRARARTRTLLRCSPENAIKLQTVWKHSSRFSTSYDLQLLSTLHWKSQFPRMLTIYLKLYSK